MGFKLGLEHLASTLSMLETEKLMRKLLGRKRDDVTEKIT